jgi:DNA-directed RNA polymerase specialized sigma24 family protein
MRVLSHTAESGGQPFQKGTKTNVCFRVIKLRVWRVLLADATMNTRVLLTTSRGAFGSVPGDEDRDNDRFRAFVLMVQPRLHSAFIAAYGQERGREATAEALAYAWEHWASVEQLTNPNGYIYRVGQSKVGRRRMPVVLVRPPHNDPWVEPGLPAALASLSERQRLAVLLVHGEGWTLREVGELLRLSVPTIQKHAERGMASLRRSLKVDFPGETRDRR